MLNENEGEPFEKLSAFMANSEADGDWSNDAGKPNGCWAVSSICRIQGSGAVVILYGYEPRETGVIISAKLSASVARIGCV